MSKALTALVAPGPRAARPRAGGLRGILRRWWEASINWRIEQAAMVQLRTISDRQLKDIGLTPSLMTGTVRGEAEREARLQVGLLSTPESTLS